MTFADIAAISDQPWAQQIAGTWLFPFFETIHVFSLVAVLGTIAIVDWRLIGFGSRDRSFVALSRQALPWTWLGFVLSIVSGAFMFVGQIMEYSTNPAFLLKMALLVLAGLNMLAFHFIGPWKTVDDWDVESPPPAGARLAGALSLTFWIGIIACGRWIAFSHGG
jgi:hypothetical protein